jgi:hypothetical protein
MFATICGGGIVMSEMSAWRRRRRPVDAARGEPVAIHIGVRSRRKRHRERHRRAGGLGGIHERLQRLRILATLPASAS